MVSPSLKIIANVWFGPSTRMRVWGKLATQIRNRMGLEESLRQLWKNAEENRSPLVDIYKHILTTIAHGRTLDDALKGLASHEEIMLLASAQASGRLVEGLNLAGKVLNAKSIINKNLYLNFLTPCMALVACIAMLVMISLHVMPQLIMVSNPDTWTGAPYLLHLISRFVGSWAGGLFGCCLLAALVATFISFPLWTGKLRRIADRCVPWSIYRLTVGTVWLYTIATRMRAGHQLSQILEHMVNGESTPYLREIVAAILSHSRHGEDFGRALQESGMNFPSREIVEDLRVYARMPGFQDQIMEIADIWLAEGVEQIAGFAQKIGLAIWLFIWGQLALVALVASNFQEQIHVGGM